VAFDGAAAFFGKGLLLVLASILLQPILLKIDWMFTLENFAFLFLCTGMPTDCTASLSPTTIPLYTLLNP
jgi:hypothetical protein